MNWPTGLDNGKEPKNSQDSATDQKPPNTYAMKEEPMPTPTLEQIEQAAQETGYAFPPEPQLGDLIETIQSHLTRYIDFDEDSLATVIACWITLTYCYESFDYCGYLAIRSPTPRCGKSRLLKLIRLFCVDLSPITTQPTGATLYRTNRKVQLLDEIDQLRNKDKEAFAIAIAVLNSGFEKGGVVERCEKEGGKFVMREYPTYGPKALAGIESLADTLADRCFHIPMKRTPRRMPRLNLRKLNDRAEEVRTQLALWFEQREEELQTLYEQLPDETAYLKGFDDRFQDISEPLTILATLADEERQSTAILPKLLQGLRRCSNRREPSGRERDLCAFLDLVEPLLGSKTETFIESERLLALAQNHEGIHRIESTKGLASFLGHFDLAPRKSPDGGKRGYMITREWVAEWDTRYRQGEESL